MNFLPEVVRSSQTTAFADDTKVFKEITSTRDAEQLQEDLSNLVTWSDSASLNFNYSKCKAQRITRKLSSKFNLPRRILVFTSLINSRGISKSMCNALKGQQATGICIRRNTRLVESITVRHSAYLPLVRSHLGYATQVWTPQSIDLIRKLKRIQRRATKYTGCTIHL